MSTIIKNSIIPFNQFRIGAEDELDLEAIAVFIALGFFLGEDTYFKGLKTLAPGTITELNEEGHMVSSSAYFTWKHEPRTMSFNAALHEFTDLFHQIMDECSDNIMTIPISGGLDSRTCLAAAHYLGNNIQTYAYEFSGGIKETEYGKKLAEVLNVPFYAYQVQPGSLWHYIGKLAKRTGAYAEFTHARPYAIHDTLRNLGGTFVLGHGGDLFFDSMGVPSNISPDQRMDWIWKRLVKSSSLALATDLWEEWGVQGDFKQYLYQKLNEKLKALEIEDANAQLRAFKSRYYVPRWTCTNLEIFQDFGPNLIPYFDDRMCNWITTVPEKWLHGRKLQIEYLKKIAPDLAKVPWQAHAPHNVYTYRWNRAPFNLPRRALNKLVRTIKDEKVVTRNWELQFLGDSNKLALTQAIHSSGFLDAIIPAKIKEKYLNLFYNDDSLTYYPAVTMLLTLCLFPKTKENKF